MFVARKLLLEG